MLLVQLLVFLIGVLIVGKTLASAIQTFVLPRSARDFLATFVFLSMRSVFHLFIRPGSSYSRRDRVMALYAPTSLLVLPVAWLTFVLIGYTGMFWAIGVADISLALRMSGSSLLTLGFAAVDGLPATILAFSEAAIGLILVALLIAYLPTMYAAFSKRETAVTMLEVRAGSPPSAITLLERYNRLDRLGQLTDLWTAWELWFAELEETHTSLAPLSFFRSPQPDHSWVTAAGAVLDAASLTVSTLDLPPDPQANLCIRAGFIALGRLSDFFRISYSHTPSPDDPIGVTREEYDAACARMQASGLPLKADLDQAWRDFAGWRVNYDTVLRTLADLTMAPYAPWSSDRPIKTTVSLRALMNRSLRPKHAEPAPPQIERIGR